MKLLNCSNELFSDVLIHRHGAGLGCKPPVLESRNMATKGNWDSKGYPAHFLQVFSWNAGNLQRSARMDTLNDLMASQFHVTSVQEADICACQQLLLESRGIASISSRDITIMINAGGSGLKVIRKCHDVDHPHCDMVHRPYYYKDRFTNKKKAMSLVSCCGHLCFRHHRGPESLGPCWTRTMACVQLTFE